MEAIERLAMEIGAKEMIRHILNECLATLDQIECECVECPECGRSVPVNVDVAEHGCPFCGEEFTT